MFADRKSKLNTILEDHTNSTPLWRQEVVLRMEHVPFWIKLKQEWKGLLQRTTHVLQK
jgi:hypothetical protein